VTNLNALRSTFALCLAALASPLCYAATEGVTQPIAATAVAGTDSTYSSSVLADAPERTASAQTSMSSAPVVMRTGIKPFSKVGIAVTIGINGLGVEVATPVAQKLNIRASGDFFSYSPNLLVDGITVNGAINFRSVNTSLDWFPFGGSFRISPGVTLYNGNTLSSTATVPAGSTFTLNDTNYISGQCSGYNPVTGACPANATYTNPVQGTFGLSFGNMVAPSITIGFGNLVPRKASKHFSVPFEIGMEYVGTLAATINLTGTACATSGDTTGCGPINSGTNQANLNAQVATINSDLNYLKTYPILKIGLGYKF
jgi:hypothetical protein